MNLPPITPDERAEALREVWKEIRATKKSDQAAAMLSYQLGRLTGVSAFATVAGLEVVVRDATWTIVRRSLIPWRDVTGMSTAPEAGQGALFV